MDISLKLGNFHKSSACEPLETAKILEDLIFKNAISFDRTLTVIDANTIRQKKFQCVIVVNSPKL